MKDLDFLLGWVLMHVVDNWGLVLTVACMGVLIWWELAEGKEDGNQ